MSNQRNKSISGTVAGTPVVLPVRTYPVSVTVIPGAGNTSLCEFSTTSENLTPVWQPWPAGTVSATTNDAIISPITALRFTRVSGSSADTYEVVS
jgi:hypothetical protein